MVFVACKRTGSSSRFELVLHAGFLPVPVRWVLPCLVFALLPISGGMLICIRVTGVVRAVKVQWLSLVWLSLGPFSVLVLEGP